MGPGAGVLRPRAGFAIWDLLPGHGSWDLGPGVWDRGTDYSRSQITPTLCFLFLFLFCLADCRLDARLNASSRLGICSQLNLMLQS